MHFRVAGHEKARHMTGVLATDKYRFVPGAVIVLLLIAQLVLAYGWLEKYPMPFGPEILSQSMYFTQAIEEDGLGGALSYWFASDYYPVGYEAGLGILHYLFGFSRFNASIINFLSIALALLSVYLIGVMLGGRFAGFLAALLILLYPGVFVNARIPLREVALIGPAACCIWALLASKDFTLRLPAVVFAIAFSAGMYVKWSLFLAVVAPVGFYFIGLVITRKRERRTILGKRQAINIILASSVTLLILGPWYIFSLDWALIGEATRTDPLKIEGVTNWLLHYSHAFQLSGTYWVFAWCALIGLVAVFFRKDNRGIYLIIIWLVGGYIVLTLIPHKEPRYILPLLPAAALVTSIAVGSLKKPIVRWILLIIIVSYGIWQFLILSFFPLPYYPTPVFPSDTGELFSNKNPKCYKSPALHFKKIVDIMDQNSVNNSGRVSFATHPFNTKTLLFGDEMLSYFFHMRAINNAFPEYTKTGYTHLGYDLFYENLDQIDFLLIDVNIINGGPEYLLPKVDFWKNRVTVHEKNLDVPEDDPGLNKLIHSKFESVGTVSTFCLSSIAVYRKIDMADN